MKQCNRLSRFLAAALSVLMLTGCGAVNEVSPVSTDQTTISERLTNADSAVNVTEPADSSEQTEETTLTEETSAVPAASESVTTTTTSEPETTTSVTTTETTTTTSVTTTASTAASTTTTPAPTTTKPKATTKATTHASSDTASSLASSSVSESASSFSSAVSSYKSKTASNVSGSVTTQTVTTKTVPPAELPHVAAATMDKLIKNYGKACEVLVYQPETDRTLYQYNTTTAMSGASLVKLAYAVFVCQEIDAGRHRLNETRTYTSAWYHDGSGIIKNSAYGTVYSIKQLLDYSLRYSDNVAYDLLVDIFGISGFNQMVAGWGYSVKLTEYTHWPHFSANFMKTAMMKMYASHDKSDCWKVAWDALTGSVKSHVRATLGLSSPVAVKYGNIAHVYHEVCYIDSDSPYILIIFSTAVNYKEDNSFFVNVTKCAQQLVNEYPVTRQSGE